MVIFQLYSAFKKISSCINVGQAKQLWDRKLQFDGEVTNVNIFTWDQKYNIQEMSSNLCSHKGDVLSWDELIFKAHGLTEEIG